jgi:hypothetical protein
VKLLVSPFILDEAARRDPAENRTGIRFRPGVWNVLPSYFCSNQLSMAGQQVSRCHYGHNLRQDFAEIGVL